MSFTIILYFYICYDIISDRINHDRGGICMAKGFDERRPGALLSDDDTKSHYSKDYRPMTYEEAQAMRKRVRQEAIDNELQAVREKNSYKITL